ncbi:MAG: hypothetical protein ACOC6L_01170 [Thermodesulfobacteriota bacterium]
MPPHSFNSDKLNHFPETSPAVPRRAWLILLIGLLVYIGVQGYLTVSPLRGWNLTPEVDDGLTYVLKTRQMQECFAQDCPALNDLRSQLTPKPGDPDDPEVYHERVLAFSRVFPVYHPLFSVVLIGLSQLGLSLMEAYRLLWTLAPLIFGLAFAYWLTTIFGPGVAGVALILLAFKVFPDTGLHHLVPSNLTMALAVVLWARIISCRGWAPWSLVLGSLVLVTMHLVGLVYAAMAVVLALLLADARERRRLLVVVGAVGFFILIVVLVARFVRKPAFVLPTLLPQVDNPFWQMLVGTGQNILQVIIENVRLAEGLWGSPAIFCGAVVLGLGALGRPTRRVVLKIILLYAAVLGIFLFYVSNHPADVLLRLWIPLVVLLFGLVAQALCSTMALALAWWRERKAAPPQEGPVNIRRFWPVIVVAVLLGYAAQMSFRGAEQIQAMAGFLREKEPLALYPSQPKELMAQARPGDRVLYTSFILMDYYLIHGALNLGAVYYQPVFQKVPRYIELLNRPDLRFAVAYQPTMYHPSFAGRDEARWWITTPEFRYSPLSQTRRQGPLAREGQIPAALYRWLDIEAVTADVPETLRLYLDNPGGESELEVVPLDPGGELQERYRQSLKIPARQSVWLEVNLAAWPAHSAIRLIFPPKSDRYRVGGITFGKSTLHWPWAQKARLTFQPRQDCASPITVSFDPAALLPESMKNRQVTVLDDRGSSVLLELKQ